MVSWKGLKRKIYKSPSSSCKLSLIRWYQPGVSPNTKLPWTSGPKVKHWSSKSFSLGILYHVDKRKNKILLKSTRKNIILCSYLIQRCVTIFHSCTVIFKNLIICLKPSGQKSRFTIPLIRNNSTLLFHFPICTLEEHLQPMVV